MKLSKEKYGSPRITGEILDCSLPMTFDQYNNCGHNCLYCFSTFQRAIGSTKDDYWHREEVKAVDPKKFAKLFSPEYKGQFSYIIKNRKPMQWGGLSDPFCPIEKELGVGYEILQLLAKHKYPCSFSSKGDLLLTDKKYWDIFMANKENYHYKASIITADEEVAKIIEAGVPTPKRRFEVLKALSDAGVETTLRMRPFIIGITDKTMPELIRMGAEAGVKSVSTEFFCLETRMTPALKTRYKAMSKLCGFDIVEYYKKLSTGCGYLRLNYQIKEKYIKAVKTECEKYGIRLHVSDAHHKELSCTGSCCGLPDNHPTLSNYQKSQFTNAIVIARKNGTVKFSEIAEDFEWLKSFLWRNAEGFNTGNNDKRLKRKNLTMFEFMRNAWNNPKDLHGPYKYFGGALRPIDKDENGDLIYKYVGSWK